MAFTIAVQNGRSEAKLLKNNREWLRGCNRVTRGRDLGWVCWGSVRGPSEWALATSIYHHKLNDSLRALMPDAFKLGFAPFALPARGVLIVFCNDGLQLGPATRDLLGNAAGMVRKAAAAER